MTPGSVGVDVGGTHMRAIGIDDAGVIVARSRAETPVDDADAAVDAIVATVLATGHDGPVGVGAPGIVMDGILVSGANVAWRDLDLRTRLAAALGRPVIVENDCTAGGMGEWRAGAARGVDDVVYVGVGTGIGGGLVLGGHLYRGATNAAGEVGHVIVEPDGHRCGCGNRGCWETVASGSAITRDGRAAVTRHAHSLLAKRSGGDPDAVTGEMVSTAAADGDPAALGILAEAGTRLGQGIAGLVNVLDPAIVVVGGGVAAAGEMLFAPTRRAYVDAVQLPDPPPIVAAALGPDAAAVGAALLALEPSP